MAGWYSSPQTPSVGNVIRTPVLDASGIGSAIGGVIKNYKISDIIRNTTRNPGETEAQHKARVLDATNAMVPNAGESNAAYNARMTGAYNTVRAPESDDAYMARIDAAVKAGTPIPSYDYGEKDYATTRAKAVQAQAPQTPGETPDAFAARQSQVASTVAPRQEQEPVSSYYNRLSSALANVDQDRAMQYKQEAVKQKAIEDFQGQNRGMSAPERITGIGETLLPFSASEGTGMITAGANLGLSQQAKAKEMLGPVAADMRGVADAPTYLMKRAKWVQSNPMLDNLLPASYSPQSMASIMTEGGLGELVTPEAGTMPRLRQAEMYNNSIKAQLDAAMQAYNEDPRSAKSAKDAPNTYGLYQTWLRSSKSYNDLYEQILAPGNTTVDAPVPTGASMVMPGASLQSSSSAGGAPVISSVGDKKVIQHRSIISVPTMVSTFGKNAKEAESQLAVSAQNKENQSKVTQAMGMALESTIKGGVNLKAEKVGPALVAHYNTPEGNIAGVISGTNSAAENPEYVGNYITSKHPFAALAAKTAAKRLGREADWLSYLTSPDGETLTGVNVVPEIESLARRDLESYVESAKSSTRASIAPNKENWAQLRYGNIADTSAINEDVERMLTEKYKPFEHLGRAKMSAKMSASSHSASSSATAKIMPPAGRRI